MSKQHFTKPCKYSYDSDITLMARSLFRIQDNIATPCSTKQNGAYLKPCLSSLDITVRDLQFSNSISSISNINSSEKRLYISSYGLF